MSPGRSHDKEKSWPASGDRQPDGAMGSSGIRDNYSRGTVGDFLQAKIQPGSTLAIVSAYFTIYTFEAMKEQLKGIDGLRFLFGEPRFVKALDPEKTDKKAFKIEDDGLQLINRLEQKRVARECAAWLNRCSCSKSRRKPRRAILRADTLGPDRQSAIGYRSFIDRLVDCRLSISRSSICVHRFRNCRFAILNSAILDLRLPTIDFRLPMDRAHLRRF